MVAVDFMNTDLTEALFDNCNLRRAVFVDTNLQKADFYSSHNYTIDPEKNKLKKAIFSSQGLKGLLEKYDLVVK
ncbi:hypothetical protein GCM10011343_04820 [Flavobacterium orientale]|uniref:Pentapeptide repeat-containing protein n=2 Tax=Flavobacterium orientale TaxID=1756020 RepID=A0A916XW43_9FLAO|nr:hypothetical protein GCM10011343_04820 [Flavobacterium orientale]